ncbi:MAG: hypothetical protein QXE16_04935, partial [Candidatus Bathyarchaeia archaeon]
MTELEAVDPQERFLELFKTEKYRQRISQLAVSGKSSLMVDFEDILTFDHSLADALLERPSEYLKYADNAAQTQLEIEAREYAERQRITVRIVKLLDSTPLRKLGA